MRPGDGENHFMIRDLGGIGTQARRRLATTGLLTGLLLIFFLALLTRAVQAEDLWQKQRRLKELYRHLREEKYQLRAANAREKELSRQLHDARNRLDYVHEEIGTVKVRIGRTREYLTQVESDLASAEAKAHQARLGLDLRLVEIYENGRIGYIEVLLGAASFKDFVRRTDLLSQVINRDRDVLAELRRLQARIAREREIIHQQHQVLLSYANQLRQKQTMLTSIESRREVLLEDVGVERRVHAQKVYELEEHSVELEREVQALIRDYQARQGKSTPSGATGRFTWPARGWVSSYFGWRIHPIYGSRRFHTGVDLAIEWGVPVRAADGGTVIVAEWYGGYGNCIIIDHGHGLSTLYGHLSSIYVGSGRHVGKGDVIGAVGSTGNSTGPHLHFEVRQNGTPVDPFGFLR